MTEHNGLTDAQRTTLAEVMSGRQVATALIYRDGKIGVISEVDSLRVDAAVQRFHAHPVPLAACVGIDVGIGRKNDSAP